MNKKLVIVLLVGVVGIFVMANTVVACKSAGEMYMYEHKILKKDLKTIISINKVLGKGKVRGKVAKLLVVKRSKLIDKNYKYMTKKKYYKKMSFKYGLDWEC